MVRHVGRVAFWTIGLDVSTRTSSSNHWEIYEVNESWTGSFCGGNTDLEFTFTRSSPIKNVIEHWASHMNLRCQVFGAVFVVVFVVVGDVVVVLLVLLAKHIQNLGDLTKGKFQRHLINTFQQQKSIQMSPWPKPWFFAVYFIIWLYTTQVQRDCNKLGGGGFKYVLFSPPNLGGNGIQFDKNMFQLGWFNHQPANHYIYDMNPATWTFQDFMVHVMMSCQGWTLPLLQC